MWYNKNRKTTAHKVGCRCNVKRKSTLRPASFGVVFLCLDYCVAKIYECGIIKIERQPPTRWVADSMGQKIRLGEWQITEAVFLCA